MAWSLKPREVEVLELEVPPDCTLAQALLVLRERLPHDTARALGELDQAHWSIWGRRIGLDQRLSAHDRLEWTRPLRVDPKMARRERFAQQGARSAGLFARPTQRPR